MDQAGPRIRITYLSKHGETPAVLDLTPADYYDPIGPNETYDQHGIPRFDHAYTYTPCPPDDLLWTVLEVISAGGDDTPGRTVFHTQFLDGAKSMMTHRADPDGYEEIIHTTEADPGRWHIVRTVKPPGGLWAVAMSNLTDMRPVAEAADRDYCGDCTVERRKGFSDVGIR